MLEGGFHVSRALAVRAFVSLIVNCVDIAFPAYLVEEVIASNTIDLLAPPEISLTYRARRVCPVISMCLFCWRFLALTWRFLALTLAFGLPLGMVIPVGSPYHLLPHVLLLAPVNAIQCFPHHRIEIGAVDGERRRLHW